MRQYGEYSGPSLFKLQFILEKIFPRIYCLRGINVCHQLKQLFQEPGKLIRDQTEITGIPVIWQQQMWPRTTLLTDKEVQFATAKTFVFSESVLCLGGTCSDPVGAWKDKIHWCMESRRFGELDREWNIAPGFTTLGILAEIQK